MENNLCSTSPCEVEDLVQHYFALRLNQPDMIKHIIEHTSTSWPMANLDGFLEFAIISWEITWRHKNAPNHNPRIMCERWTLAVAFHLGSALPVNFHTFGHKYPRECGYVWIWNMCGVNAEWYGYDIYESKHCYCGESQTGWYTDVHPPKYGIIIDFDPYRY